MDRKVAELVVTQSRLGMHSQKQQCQSFITAIITVTDVNSFLFSVPTDAHFYCTLCTGCPNRLQVCKLLFRWQRVFVRSGLIPGPWLITAPVHSCCGLSVQESGQTLRAGLCKICCRKTDSSETLATLCQHTGIPSLPQTAVICLKSQVTLSVTGCSAWRTGFSLKTVHASLVELSEVALGEVSL
jgi:hypothetical protein